MTRLLLLLLCCLTLPPALRAAEDAPATPPAPPPVTVPAEPGSPAAPEEPYPFTSSHFNSPEPWLNPTAPVHPAAPAGKAMIDPALTPPAPAPAGAVKTPEPAQSAPVPAPAGANGQPQPAPATTPTAALPDSGQLPPALGQGKNDAGAFPLSLAEAVLLSFDNNIELRSQRIAPQKAADYIQIARAAFDPTLNLGYDRTLYDHDHNSGGETEGNSGAFGGSLSQFAPTGTTVRLDSSLDDDYTRSYSSRRTSTNSWSGDAGLNISQALLRGRGTEVNLVTIRKARLDLQISRYQLQNYTESLIVNVENAYWNCVLALTETSIIRDSLKIAQQQLSDTQDKILIKVLPPIDLFEAKATVADRNVQLIEVNNRFEQYRLGLIRLINPQQEGKWTMALAIDAMPGAPAVKLDPVEDHVRLALEKRPDINESRLRVRKGELELVRTANGLLPRLDFYVDVRGGGGTYRSSANLDYGTDDLTVATGVDFSYALGNRSPRAQHDISKLDMEQIKLALENLSSQIQVEVRSAHLDVIRYSKQIEATRLAREQYEQSLLAEKEKFRVGRSTNIAVAIAQNNYLQSRLNEVRAIISTIKSLTALYRYDGSLLLRRGIVLPE